ncbi:MAG: LysE family translocator [Muribaculaceae bacterium]
MEELFYIMLRGLAIGILLSAPMGPVGVFIVQRTLSRGRWPAMLSGVGAGLSDLIYCFIAGFSMSFITDYIEAHEHSLKLIGSLIIVVFAVYLFRKNPTRTLKTADSAGGISSYWTDFVTGFLFTLSNPLILLMIMPFFARFTFVQPDYMYYHYIVAFLSIFAGALLWWYGITWLVNRLRRRFNVRSLKVVNRVISAILMAMALIGIISSIPQLIQH